MKKILLLFCIFFLLSCTKVTPYEKVEVQLERKTFEVLIADNKPKLQKGLMDTPYLADNKGMLFVFPDSKQRSFWMKNVEYPLDAYFFDENLILTEKILMKPCTEDPCEVYTSEKPAKYVLELNADIYDFKPGTIMVKK